MRKPLSFVGLDVHKREIHVALLEGHATLPVTWVVPNEPHAVERLWRQLDRDHHGAVQCAYEAGPCGYVLQRRLTRGRVTCQVIAPALMPRKPGERIKTDRRDARKLAELLRAGLLTEVHPPTPAEEAARDLARAREDAREDLLRARHHIGTLLLRRGLHYAGSHWTPAHRRWLRAISWAHAAERQVVENYLLALEQVEGRILELDAHLEELARTPPYRDPVGWLRCFRGIDSLTAMLLLAELHDFRRFPSPRGLMAYLGLVPCEASSGMRTRRGPITKAGNRLVRRVLIEVAWHYRHRAGVGRVLQQRRVGQPGHIIAIADKAQQRLCRRFRRLTARQCPSPKAVVAVARELTGFLWAALQPVAPAA